MSLLKKLEQEVIKASTSICKVGNLLVSNDLSKKEKDQLFTLLDTSTSSGPRVPNTTIGRVLREEGYYISNSSIDRHRRRDCNCSRAETL